MGTASSGYIATVAALNNAYEWHETVMQQLEQNRMRLSELLTQHLPGAIYNPPQATYLAWVDFRATDQYETIAAEVTGQHSLAEEVAQRCGVVATDGAETGADGVGHLRINFATAPRLLETIATRLGSVFST